MGFGALLGISVLVGGNLGGWLGYWPLDMRRLALTGIALTLLGFVLAAAAVLTPLLRPGKAKLPTTHS